MTPGRFFHAVAVLFLALLTVALYAQTLDDEWHFDDLAELTPAVRDFAPRVDPSHYRGNLVRWLWAIDYRLHGEDPTGYHVSNGLLHFANTLLVYALAWALLARAGRARGFAALAAAAVFGAHPLATQAVTYVTQRSTSLAALFFLASLLGWIAFRRTGSRSRWLLCGTALGTLALGLHTKHVMVLLPVALVAYEILFRPLRRRLELVLLVPFAVLAGARALDYGPQLERTPPVWAERSAPTPGAAQHHTATEYALTQPRSIAAYLQLFVLPFGQNLDRDVRPSRSVFEPKVLGSLALLAAFAIAAGRLRPAHPAAAFGIFLFFLALVPTSSLVPSADLFFEHRAYLPLAGLSLGVGALGAAAHRRRPRAAWIGLAVVVAALAVATHRRNAVWDTELTLWSDVVAKSPDKARPHVNLGLALRNAGRLDEAERHYRRALEIRPDYPFALNNLGNVLRQRGRLDDAERLFRSAIESRPQYVDPRINLGNVAMDRDDLAAADAWYRDALALAPRATEARYNLAKSLERRDRIREAIREYARVADERPDDPVFVNDLGCARLAAGELAAAERDLRRAIALRDDWEVTWYNLGLVLEAQGRSADARRAFERALEIAPGLEPARQRLAALRAE